MGCRAERLHLATWREVWLPRLDSDRLLIGLNWAGRGLRDVDVGAAQVLRALRLPELGEQDRDGRR